MSDLAKFDPLSRSALAALRARAAEQNETPPLLADPLANQWWDRLGAEQLTWPRAAATRVAVCARAGQFDAWTADWLAKHPDGLVIELGVGFGTRFNRLSLPASHCLGVDRSATLDHLRPLRPNGMLLAGDVTAQATLDRIAEQAADRAVCLIAEGLLMYLSRHQVHLLLNRLAERFADMTLLFDAYATPARSLARFHDSLPHLRLPLRSTFPRSPRLRIDESRTLRDLPAAYARLPHRHRLPLLHRLYGLHRATLLPH